MEVQGEKQEEESSDFGEKRKKTRIVRVVNQRVQKGEIMKDKAKNKIKNSYKADRFLGIGKDRCPQGHLSP